MLAPPEMYPAMAARQTGWVEKHSTIWVRLFVGTSDRIIMTRGVLWPGAGRLTESWAVSSAVRDAFTSSMTSCREQNTTTLLVEHSTGAMHVPTKCSRNSSTAGMRYAEVLTKARAKTLT